MKFIPAFILLFSCSIFIASCKDESNSDYAYDDIIGVWNFKEIDEFSYTHFAPDSMFFYFRESGCHTKLGFGIETVQDKKLTLSDTDGGSKEYYTVDFLSYDSKNLRFRYTDEDQVVTFNMAFHSNEMTHSFVYCE